MCPLQDLAAILSSRPDSSKGGGASSARRSMRRSSLESGVGQGGPEAIPALGRDPAVADAEVLEPGQGRGGLDGGVGQLRAQCRSRSLSRASEARWARPCPAISRAQAEGEPLELDQAREVGQVGVGRIRVLEPEPTRRVRWRRWANPAAVMVGRPVSSETCSFRRLVSLPIEGQAGVAKRADVVLQGLQARQGLEVGQPRSGDLGVGEVEVLEVRQAGQMGQPRVGDLRAGEVEAA